MALRPLSNEKELLAKASRGDRDAFAALFWGYHQPLVGYVRGITGSLSITQDIVQDVFIKVWLRRAELEGIDYFTGWLFILARNQTVNALKKRVADLHRDRHWMDQFDRDIEPAPGEDGDHYRVLLENAVDRLPPQQQKVYRLHRQDRLNRAEIAEKLGIAPSTVKSNLEEAVKNIRRQLKGPVDPVIIFILLAPLASS